MRGSNHPIRDQSGLSQLRDELNGSSWLAERFRMAIERFGDFGVAKDAFGSRLFESLIRQNQGFPDSASFHSALRGVWIEDLYLAYACCSHTEEAWIQLRQEFLKPKALLARRITRSGLGRLVLENLESDLILGGPPCRLATYDGQGSLRAWLQVFARRQFLEEQRRLRVHRFAVGQIGRRAASRSCPPSAIQRDLANRAAVELRQSFEALPPAQRKALWYYYFGDLSQKRVGEHLGISHVQVCRQLQKSYLQLRRHALAKAPLHDHPWFLANDTIEANLRELARIHLPEES